LERLGRQDGAGEEVHRHVRATPGVMDGERAQPDRRQTEKVAVDVGHQLIGRFGGRVQAHAMLL